MSPSAPIELAYDDHSLPGETLDDRLAAAVRLRLHLEVENRGDVDIDPFRKVGLPVASVQAWLLHEFHPLSKDGEKRSEARKHLDLTLDLAARLGAPRIVTICGYGHELADRPFERSLDFFARFTGRARDLGIRILVEPLSPKKSSALTDPAEIAALVDALEAPQVFGMVVDTGHLIDSGRDLAEFFAGWKRPIDELQLRGPDGAPPRPDLPVAEWIAALPSPPSLVSVEHREPIEERAFVDLVKEFRRAIA